MESEQEEAPDLNSLTQQEDSYRCKVKATVDSCVAVSVVPNDWFTDYPIKVTAESGSIYKAAGRQLFKDEGLRQLRGLMPGSKQAVRKLNVRVAKVKKMLLSVGNIVDVDSDVAFSRNCSYIKNNRTGTTTGIKRENSAYVLDFEVLGSKVTGHKEPSKAHAWLVHSQEPVGQCP